jgi:hypothetical protein
LLLSSVYLDAKVFVASYKPDDVYYKEPKLTDASIKTRNGSIESTGTARFRPEEYLDYDVVLIDESHRTERFCSPRVKKRAQEDSAECDLEPIIPFSIQVNASCIPKL